MKLFQDSITIFYKDLVLDLRSMENVFAMLFFSIIVIMVFSFALPADDKSHALLAPGVFWVTFLLAGILSLNKSFQIEKDNYCLEALLLSPISRGAIFLGKMGWNVCFILLIQLLVIPVFSLLFYGPFLNNIFELLLLSLLTAIGFSSLGTMLSALTVDVRFKEIILPILLFPLLVPLLLASVKITQVVLTDGSLMDVTDWIKLLIGFDVIFLVISYLTFEYVMEI